MKTTIIIKKSSNWAAWSNKYVGDQLIATIDSKGIAHVNFEFNSLAQLTKEGLKSGIVNPCDFIENK